jgi:hypothetical protein
MGDSRRSGDQFASEPVCQWASLPVERYRYTNILAHWLTGTLAH